MKITCHNIEDFCQRTIEINFKYALKDKENLPTPIEELGLWSEQGRLEVDGMVINPGKQYHEVVHGDIPRTTLPLYDEADTLLENFIQKYGLSEDDYRWGDYFGMPECLYRMEMIKCAKQVALKLQEVGVVFIDSAKTGIMIEDEGYYDPEDFKYSVQKGLSHLTPDQAKEFLAMYYQDENNINKLMKTRS